MAFRTISVELRANVAAFQAQMGAAAKSTEQFGREVGQLAASSNEAVRMAGKLGVVAGGAVVVGFGLAINAASKFETGMRNVNSIMKQSEAEFRATSDAVLDISRRVPQAATTLADGLYDIASSGFQGAEGLQVLEASAVAATAGMTDTATAATAITAALNAYGDSAAEAADVSDVFFETVNLGVVTFEELAQGVGDWVGTAAALGVELDDASAALATMTLSGVQAAEASTSLNRVMQAFIKPSADMTAQIQELGYESGVAMVEALGLRGAVMQIDEATGGSVEATAGLYREVRAIRGVLALTAADGENYAAVFDAITDETERAGAAQDAYNEQSKAFSVQLDLAKSSLTAVAIEIGTAFLPAMTSAVEFVGKAADAFASLPGPIRTATTLLTGLAGVIALVGGAALLAAPRIMAIKAAMDEATASSARLAAVQARTATAIRGIGTALGYAAPFLIGGALVMHQNAKEAREADQRVQGFTDAIMAAGDAVEGTQDRIAALVKEDVDFAGWLNEAGVSADKFGAALAGTDEDWAVMRARMLESAEAAGYTGLQLQFLDEGLDRARAEALEAAGAAEVVGRALEEDAAEAFKVATAEAEKLGISLDETSELAGMTADEMAELQASIDPVIFSMLEMGSVTVEQAEGMQKAMDGYVSSVEQAFARLTSPLSVHAELLESQEQAAREWAEAHAAATEDTSDTWEDYYGDQKVSADDFVAGMQQTAADTEQFMDDIQAAITHGYDPQLIADLLQQGPETAGPILETLLSDHSGTMVGMVNEAQEQLRTLNTVAAEMARLTHLAVTSSTDQMTSDLSTAMAIVQTNMEDGGRKSAEAIAEQLGVGVSEVSRIAASYGISLAEGLNPVLEGIGANPIRRVTNIIRGVVNMVTRNQGGPIPGVGDTDSVPALLTPGEFVIRKQAVQAIGVDRLHELNQADRRRYATGGFVTAADVPSPPDVSGRGSMVGYTGGEAMDHLYEQVREWVEKNAVPQGSATGLDPVFAAMFGRYNEALGGILSIISGFRSRAQQQALYDRYLAGTGNLAAPPGRSMHERGLAIDHAPRATGSMMRTAAGFGLHYPVPGEPWHVEPVRTATYDQGGILQPGFTLAYNGTGRPEMVARFAEGGMVGALGSSYAQLQWREEIVDWLLRNTEHGRRAIAGATDDEGRVDMGAAAADVRSLAETFQELAMAVDETTAMQVAQLDLSEGDYSKVARDLIDDANDRADAEKAKRDEIRKTAEVEQDAARRRQDIMFEMGRLGEDEYLVILRDRLAGLEEYSDEWYRVWQDINQITEDQARREQEAVDQAREAIDEVFRELEQARSKITGRVELDVRAGFESVNEAGNFGLVDALRAQVQEAERMQQAVEMLSSQGFGADLLSGLMQQGVTVEELRTLQGVDPAELAGLQERMVQVGERTADVLVGPLPDRLDVLASTSTEQLVELRRQNELLASIVANTTRDDPAIARALANAQVGA